MPQKLAIAISGAVSLGSYESGVMYEVIEAIAQHNEAIDNDSTLSAQEKDQKKIEIDVITGASAGAMTACILTQKLLFDADALRHPYDNSLYRPWVNDVDIQKLLKLNIQAGDNPNQSILSSALIAEVGQTHVLNRYSAGVPSQRQRHPAAAASIQLGLAMSNLNGFDYTVPLTDFPDMSNADQPTSAKFTYTCHKDRLTCTIQATAANDTLQLWKTLELAARSSGAFPFAFRTLGIDRQGNDATYSGSDLRPTSMYSFTYTDGGVFENEPLGMAKQLVNQIDEDHLHHDNRFYLYVAPGAKASSANQLFNSSQATYINTARALTGAIFTQARFQDWIVTGQINEAVRMFDERAIGLRDFFADEFLQQDGSEQTKQVVNSVTEQLLHRLYPTAEDAQQQQDDHDRLRKQFDSDYTELTRRLASRTDADEIASIWLNAVQALEKAAELGERDVMRVYAITSQDVDLAGERLFAFGGFFDRRFRDFDYNVGRRKATHFLQQLQALHQHGNGEGQLYLTHFVAGQDLPEQPENLGNVDLQDVPRDIRVSVKNQLIDRLKRIIESLETRIWVRWLLQFSLWIFVSKHLDKLLELE
jgi:predicted acylesterase/phospholipase RssA/phosphoglycolate phosphatase-like HAD superfamily hydrolase